MNDQAKSKEQLITELNELRLEAAKNAEKAAELAHMNSILHTVNSTLDQDEVVDKVMTALQDIFAFNQISIYLFNAEKNTLEPAAWYGEKASHDLREKFENYPLSIEWDEVYFIKAFLDNEPQYVSPITPELLEFYSARDRQMFEWNPHKSIMILPLQVQEKVIGVINFVHTDEAFNLSQDEFEKVQRYVAQIAATINNAYLVRKTKYALEQAHISQREIAHLNEVIQATNATLEFDEVFAAILRGLQDIFEFDAIGIQLIDEAQDLLNIYKVYGEVVTDEKIRRWRDIRISAKDKGSISSYVFCTGELAYFPVVTADLPFTEIDYRIFAVHPFLSYLSLPLIVQGKTTGVISFFCTRNHLNLNDSDLEKIQRYVTALSTAINNARNYELLRGSHSGR